MIQLNVKKIFTSNPGSYQCSRNSGRAKISVTYSIFFNIPNTTARSTSPRIIVASKNPIKIPKSISNFIFDVHLKLHNQ